VGGNYAASFRGTEAAHAQGYDCLFTDAKTHKYIDECSAANFIGIRESKVESQKVPTGTPIKRMTEILSHPILLIILAGIAGYCIYR
jgi:branched-subunit amino acid aminotransferase/4-amino-4-deoxychorismate lyase